MNYTLVMHAWVWKDDLILNVHSFEEAQLQLEKARAVIERLGGEIMTAELKGPEGSRMVQTPSVGRVIHYVTRDGYHRPALVTGIPKPTLNKNLVDLTFFPDPVEDVSYPNPAQAVSYVEQDEAHGRETWHWPEYVP